MVRVMSLMPYSPLGGPHLHHADRANGRAKSPSPFQQARPRHQSINSLASAHGTSIRPPLGLPRSTIPFAQTSGYVAHQRAVEYPALHPSPALFSCGSSSTSSSSSSFVSAHTNTADAQSTLPTLSTDLGDSALDYALLVGHDDTVLDTDPGDKSPHPFHRWLSTLRRKGASRAPGQSEGPLFNDAHEADVTPMSQHRKSTSWSSSIDNIHTVKSASLTTGSSSILPHSRSDTGYSPGPRLWRGGSSVSNRGQRRSTEDSQSSRTFSLDEAAMQLSCKRREKVEEILRSEEGYIADLKALNNAYFTLLPPFTRQPSALRIAARGTIADLLCLHADLLSDLRQVIPFSDAHQHAPMPRLAHMRWHSDDMTTMKRQNKSFSASGWSSRPSVEIHRTPRVNNSAIKTCSPLTIADVATVFTKHMQQFSLYDEYAARYALLQEDIDHVSNTTEFDKAIETLSASLNSTQSREANRKKALTMRNLLIKPIQRITRYVLLFTDMSKVTPSCDDPTSNAVLHNVIAALSEVCRGVNDAKDDPEGLRRLDIARLLRTRLVFRCDIDPLRLQQRLGRLQLCGCLFVAYRTKSAPQGQYMIIILFESYLLLATYREPERYHVQLCISLATCSVEETDSGKGLQCHTAPHAWKVVFESGDRTFEIILVACSRAEKSAWWERMSLGHSPSPQSSMDEIASPLVNHMKCVAKSIDKGCLLGRSSSVHRSLTLGPKTEVNTQVIITHTQAHKAEGKASSSSTSLPPRSKSVTSPSRIPTLSPLRTDRIKLEAALTDVWTKDVIPYPGMGHRRGELSFRGTANDLMRKFSMVSIASNFSKRSMSFTSSTQSSFDGQTRRSSRGTMSRQSSGEHVHEHRVLHKQPPPMAVASAASPQKKNKVTKPQRPMLATHQPRRVDFHTAPDAFLPEDFELHESGATRQWRRLGLRSLTMTGERAMSPLMCLDPHREGNDSSHRSARIAQDRRGLDTSEPLTSSPSLQMTMNPVSGDGGQADAYSQARKKGQKSRIKTFLRVGA